jgi:hypothetical protein
MLGLISVSLLFFLTLAFMGTTVSAWYVVIFIVPTFIEAILKRLYDMT